MKLLVVYALLFIAVFLVTYAFVPLLGIETTPPPDQVIRTPFQDWRGLISV